MLLNGIKVSCCGNLNERILLSGGTVYSNQLNGNTTLEPVFIPKNDWRIPSKEEYNILIKGKCEKSHYNQISIVTIDRKTQNLLKGVGFDNCIHKEQIAELLFTKEWLHTKLSLIKFSKRYLKGNNDIFDLGVSYKRGNLTNTTVDTKTSSYVGLHVDSWDCYDYLHERKTALNRICFNLTSSPRYLLFLNLDLENAYKYYSGNRHNFNNLLGTDYSYVWDFLKENSNYPIVKMRINPYEAYIAPTENIVHDGCSIGNNLFDIIFTLRSFFYYRYIFFH